MHVSDQLHQVDEQDYGVGAVKLYEAADIAGAGQCALEVLARTVGEKNVARTAGRRNSHMRKTKRNPT